MSRARDAVLATTILLLAIVFGWIATASPRWRWALAGAIAAVVAELLAYRRPGSVRSPFDCAWATPLAAALAGVAVGAGAFVAPDRSLSLAVGALGIYLGMLAVVAGHEWAGDAKVERDDAP